MVIAIHPPISSPKYLLLRTYLLQKISKVVKTRQRILLLAKNLLILPLSLKILNKICSLNLRSQISPISPKWELLSQLRPRLSSTKFACQTWQSRDKNKRRVGRRFQEEIPLKLKVRKNRLSQRKQQKFSKKKHPQPLLHKNNPFNFCRHPKFHKARNHLNIRWLRELSHYKSRL